MANENVLKYLRENGGRFSKEVLRDKLLRAGYPADQVEEGIRIVYGGAVPTPLPSVGAKPSFWNFRSVRVYTSFGEKLIDFLAGFFIMPILWYILAVFIDEVLEEIFYMNELFIIGPLVLGMIVVYILGIFYLWKRRHYFARGLLFILILPFLLVGAGILIFILLGGFGRMFY